jgi:hypothetical protein
LPCPVFVADVCGCGVGEPMNKRYTRVHVLCW